MLARTADSIFWVSRYMERADFLARIVQATQRLSGLPSAYGVAGSSSGRQGSEWDSALEASGAAEGFLKTGAPINETNVVEYLAFSVDNLSSIRNCIAFARANARSIRVALTAEMWEAINAAWFELVRFEQQMAGGGMERVELTRFLDFVKQASLDFDGRAYRTMLRNDAYWFSRLGVYIERADNTARLLDVKYNVLLPESEVVGGSLDYFQWTAILRAVSALTQYHWVYRQSVKPWLVADLLILKMDMPRSLVSCYDNIVYFLDAIGRAYGRQGGAQHHARNVYERLRQSSTRDIFQAGLHEFITNFVEDNSRLGETISLQYLDTAGSTPETV